VHLDHHGRRVILLCAHFRSKVRDDPDRRAAEGATAAMVVAEAVRAHPGALVLLAGDLNDVPGSEALRALEGVPMERAAATLGEGGDITWRGAAGAFALDHILRATAGGGRLAPGGVTVLRDGDGGYGGSDHAALRAEFALE
jgi:endonuclease/exonuclease/phosphatase (EEP) superfamily protein YafD